MKMINKFIMTSFFISAFMAVGAVSSYASLMVFQSGTTGAAEGFIKDAKTGEMITKANITIVFTKTESLKHELYSDKKGHFYKGGLIPGIYKYTVKKDGYLPVAGSVRVRLGDKAKIDIELDPYGNVAPKSDKFIGQALKLFENGKYEEAIIKFTDGISKDQSNPVFYYYRGLSFERSGNNEKALEDYNKAIELKADFILPHSRIGIVYAKQRDYEKASEFYKKSVELGDKDTTTLYNYGVVLVNLGKSQDAKAVFEKLLSLDENYSEAYYHLGIIYIGLGNTSEAKGFLQRFIDMDPENKNAAIAKEIIKNLG